MEFLMLWLIFASIGLVATIVPGPAFVITLRNAMAYDRKTGIFTAIGLGLVTIVLTQPQIKTRFMRIAHWVERICGGLLMALGVRLALSKMN